MKQLLSFIYLIIFLFYKTSPILALEPPTPISPPNSETVSSSTLTWQPLDSATKYRVVVGTTSDLSSSLKDYQTEKTKYSPSLPEGQYFWRVKAKDTNGWSDWSNTWSFTLRKSESSPTPEQPSSSNPTTKPKSNFTISETPSEISSSQSFSVKISLSLPENPNSNFFLKAAFKKPDSSNYFGFTKVSDNWIKNNANFSSQFPITTDQNGNWSNTLEVKADPEDSGFTGTDNYLLKIGRYNSSGSGPTWSNELNLKIIQENPETPQPSEIPTSSPEVLSAITKPQKKTASISANYTLPKLSTPTPTPQPVILKKQKLPKSKLNLISIFGGLFIICSISIIIYIYIKRKYYE